MSLQPQVTESGHLLNNMAIACEGVERQDCGGNHHDPGLRDTNLLVQQCENIMPKHPATPVHVPDCLP